MSSNYNDTENYCKDCDRSIHGEYPSCDINIENDGRYVKAGSPCYCKVNSTVGGMVEKYPWENRKLKKCPFCGGEAEMCSDSDIYGEYWYIRCKNCFGRGASYYESFSALVENERFFTIQRAWGNAIKAWNRRVGVIKENGKCN